MRCVGDVMLRAVYMDGPPVNNTFSWCHGSFFTLDSLVYESQQTSPPPLLPFLFSGRGLRDILDEPRQARRGQLGDALRQASCTSSKGTAVSLVLDVSYSDARATAVAFGRGIPFSTSRTINTTVHGGFMIRFRGNWNSETLRRPSERCITTKYH